PSRDATVQLGELPGGLRAKPSLMWNVESATGGDHRVRVDYQTGGITWRADYNLAVAPSETSATLTAWVSLLNVSGTTYKDAELRLVAGSVRRIREVQHARPMSGVERMSMARDQGFAEDSIGENHRYTLGRRMDVPSNSTQQLMLFPTVQDVKVRKELLYVADTMGSFGDRPELDAGSFIWGDTKVSVWFILENNEASHLGMPLPAGKVRVSQLDESSSGEFVGEDVIGHTPRGQTVRLNIGESFDVTGERKRTDVQVDTARRQATETFEITLKNGKKKPETVLVRDRMWRWSSWKLTAASLDGKPVDPRKIDSNTVEQSVTVPADGKAVLTYTVQYRW
ncbi:MAG: DUF4139 domain-containing protein, partial [Phycisphaerae bacterium]|nr:DUF4139 domain-containing protein [Phycisphaerae bacterium]